MQQGKSFSRLSLTVQLIAWITFGMVPSLFSSGRIPLRFDRLTVSRGLSAGGVICILQDHQGYLWAGTQDGLNRYDGYDFKVFKNRFSDKSSLSSDYITKLFEDTTHTLWIGTQKGLNRYNALNGTFEHFLVDPVRPGDLTANEISGIWETKSGILLVATGTGLHRLLPDTGEFIRWEAVNSALPEKIQVTAFLEDTAGKIWIGTRHGLYAWNPKANEARHFAHKPGDGSSLSNDSVTALLQDGNGRLWVGTRKGLNHSNEQQTAFQRLLSNPGVSNLVSSGHITTLFEDTRQRLWIGTTNGLCLLADHHKNDICHYQYEPLNDKTLSNNYITQVLEDHSGNVWISTYGGGLNKLNPRKQEIRHVAVQGGKASGLNHNLVMAFMETPNGRLLVGTYGGLNIRDPFTALFTFHTHDPGRRNSLSGNSIRALEGDGQGGVFIGTMRTGLCHLDHTGRHFTYDFSLQSALNNSNGLNILHLLKDGDTLWVATSDRGLLRYDVKRGQTIRYKHNANNPKSLSSDATRVLLKGDADTLWIGTWGGGLNRLDIQTGTFTVYLPNADKPESISGNIVVSLYQKESGTLWIGTWGGGLNRFDKTTRTFKSYGTKDGLPSNVIQGILADDQANLWLSTNNGLCRFNTRTGKVKNFDESDGLQNKEFNSNACYRDAKGRLYFGGINGYNVFSPADIMDNTVKPPVVITSFKIHNREYPLDIHREGGITLRHDQNHLSFEFAALDLTNPHKNRYAYRMSGIDKDWVDTDARRRFVNYTNLRPGNYCFQVKGSNHDRVWNETGLILEIKIKPALYGTWWFRIIALVLIAAASYFAVLSLKKLATLILFWRKSTRIGNYRIQSKIAEGGMATIYRARDKNSKKTVALKVIKEEIAQDQVNKKRFINEGQIISAIDHPHIVKIFTQGEDQGRLFLAMEYLEGITLAQKLADPGPVAIPFAVQIIRQVASALQAIHARNILHRDIKPENIMLLEDEDKPLVKLMDFGLARDLGTTRLTQSGMIIGTICYMPPEQLSRAPLTFAADIYSLGMVFYELLTGTKPFIGESSLEIMNQILTQSPISPSSLRSEIPENLDVLILKMVAKDPEQRPDLGAIVQEL